MITNKQVKEPFKIVLVEDDLKIAKGINLLLKRRLDILFPDNDIEIIAVNDIESFKNINYSINDKYIVDLNLGTAKGDKAGLDILENIIKSIDVNFRPIIYTGSNSEIVREVINTLGIPSQHFITKGVLEIDIKEMAEIISQDYKQYLLLHPKKLIIPSFSKEDLFGEDQLNFTPDIEALAMLIASKSNTPPLSIGIFADWGSGKSFFMNKLETQINSLCDFKFNTSETEMPFVERVLNINFNAWHYMDTDLWSSIFCHIISRLSQDLYLEDGDHNQLEKLYEELEFFRLSIKGLEIEKEELEKKQSYLKSKLEKMRQQLGIQGGDSTEKTLEEKTLEDQIGEYALKIKRVNNKIKKIKKGLDLDEYLPKLFSKYDKNLGLIAAIRKDLQTLNDKFLNDQGFRAEGVRIDRIVLYIDDLDRCQPEKVVAVLQAIHLLLAFELFVVVVGVDIRWVSKAISNVYPHLQDGTNLDARADKLNTATSFDYLEKIFQIPYRLPTLNQDSVIKLLNSVLADDLAIEEEEITEISPPIELENKDFTDIQKEDSQASTFNETKLLMTSEKINITTEEMKFIYSLAPLLTKSPRTIKRFVNTFRIIKVHANGPIEREEIQAALLTLAIQVGTPTIAYTLFLAMEKTEKTTPEFQVLLKEEKNLGFLGYPQFQEFYELLERINQKENIFTIPVYLLTKYLPLVKSFSFRTNY